MTELHEYTDDEHPDAADQSKFALAEDDNPTQHMTEMEVPDDVSTRDQPRTAP